MTTISLTQRDRAYLADFAQFVVMNHVVAAEALRAVYADASGSAGRVRARLERLSADDGRARAEALNDAARVQTIAVARLLSEYVAAIEDLAGMMIAVRDRADGVLRGYMYSTVSDTGMVLADIEGGKAIPDILDLPDVSTLPDSVDPELRAAIEHAYGAFSDLLRQVAAAARMVPATEAVGADSIPPDTLHVLLEVGDVDGHRPRGVLFQAHNRLKHRFMVVENLTALGVDPAEPITFAHLGRRQAILDTLVSNITQVALATAELAALLLQYPE